MAAFVRSVSRLAVQGVVGVAVVAVPFGVLTACAAGAAEEARHVLPPDRVIAAQIIENIEREQEQKRQRWLKFANATPFSLVQNRHETPAALKKNL